MDLRQQDLFSASLTAFFLAIKTNSCLLICLFCQPLKYLLAACLFQMSSTHPPAKGGKPYTVLPLWNTIPEEYRHGHCFADFWTVYQLVIPEEQLTQVGNETAPVERWNCTLRQRLGHFVRKTLSFSKSTFMHIPCLDLFLHRYHLDWAILLG
jgi:IS1 transposase